MVLVVVWLRFCELLCWMMVIFIGVLVVFIFMCIMMLLFLFWCSVFGG